MEYKPRSSPPKIPEAFFIFLHCSPIIPGRSCTSLMGLGELGWLWLEVPGEWLSRDASSLGLPWFSLAISQQQHETYHTVIKSEPKRPTPFSPFPRKIQKETLHHNTKNYFQKTSWLPVLEKRTHSLPNTILSRRSNVQPKEAQDRSPYLTLSAQSLQGEATEFT